MLRAINYILFLISMLVVGYQVGKHEASQRCFVMIREHLK